MAIFEVWIVRKDILMAPATRPFTDFGFKKLFGTEFNKELLIDFLNQVLGDREQVQDLTYLNTENLGNTEADRKAIFDLYCENEKGEKFIIELQNVKQQGSAPDTLKIVASSMRAFQFKVRLPKEENGTII